MENVKETYEALLSLAKRWGVYVTVRPMPGPLQGKIWGIYVHKDSDEALPPELEHLAWLEHWIWLEEDLPLERQVYVLAHELGHYLYQLEHGDLPKYYWAYDKELHAKVETEVNDYAKRLLSYVGVEEVLI